MTTLDTLRRELAEARGALKAADVAGEALVAFGKEQERRALAAEGHAAAAHEALREGMGGSGAVVTRVCDLPCEHEARALSAESERNRNAVLAITAIRRAKMLEKAFDSEDALEDDLRIKATRDIDELVVFGFGGSRWHLKFFDHAIADFSRESQAKQAAELLVEALVAHQNDLHRLMNRLNLSRATIAEAHASRQAALLKEVLDTYTLEYLNAHLYPGFLGTRIVNNLADGNPIVNPETTKDTAHQ